jgi:hypothetical protein
LTRVNEIKPVLKFEMNLSDMELIGEPIRYVGKFGRPAPYKCNTTGILEYPKIFSGIQGPLLLMQRLPLLSKEDVHV